MAELTPRIGTSIAGNNTDIDTGIGDTGVDNLTIEGNYVGIDADGEAIVVPSDELDTGIRISAHGTGLQVGGTSESERNVIASGLEVDNRTNVVIQGNFMGTDRTGTSRVAIDLAATYVESCTGVTVGGTTAGAGNVFAEIFSVPSGIQSNATSLVFQGNFVGTDRTGTIALGTGVGFGISLGNVVDPLIGGTNPGEGNTIAFVDGYGIVANADYAKVLGNSIYSNTMDGLYIEAGGGHVNPSNGVQLTHVTATEIDGTYEGALGDYRLEFFATPVEPAGSPYAAYNDLQGKTFLGFEDETEGPSGVINFTFTPNVTLTADEFITATITPLVDNVTTTLSTVGFSPGVIPTIAATSSDVSVSMSASPNPVAPGGSLLYSITVTNNGSDPATGVTLSDILPAGTTFQSLSAPSGWTTTTPAVGATGTASATIASLAAGGSASFSLVVQVDPSAANGSSIEDTASVASTSTDPDSSNNSASRTVTVQTSASISPTSTGLVSSLNPATVGQAITFTAIRGWDHVRAVLSQPAF